MHCTIRPFNVLMYVKHFGVSFIYIKWQGWKKEPEVARHQDHHLKIEKINLPIARNLSD